MDFPKLIRQWNEFLFAFSFFLIRAFHSNSIIQKHFWETLDNVFVFLKFTAMNNMTELAMFMHTFRRSFKFSGKWFKQPIYFS